MTTSAPEPCTERQSLSWFRWSVARFIANSRLPQVSAFIPAIGYSLLWSDQFYDWLSSKELGNSVIGLTVHAKLQLLWWGAILMTIGWLIYLWQCPKAIRRCAEPDDYVLEQLQFRNLAYLALSRANIVEFVKGYHSHDKRPLLYGDLSPHEVTKACSAASNPGASMFDGAANILTTIYTLEFHIIDHERPRERVAAVALLVAGAVLFLTPSADVTIRVLRRLVIS